MALPRLLPAGSLRAARGLPTAPVLRGLAFGALTAAEVLIPLMLINERHLTPTGAGVVLTIGALGWSTGSWIMGHGRIGNLTALRGGALLIAGGIALISLVLIDSVPVAVAYTATGETYLVGFAFTVGLALLAAFVAPRFAQPAKTGTLEASES